MNFHIFLIMLMASHGHSLAISITQECFCNQMYTKNDCLRKEQCVWDNIQQMCVSGDETETSQQSQTPSSPITPSPTPFETILPTFCSEIISNEICASNNVCAWENNTCTHFTTCTVFTNNCSKISNQCISDGTNCIEKTSCSKYMSAVTCKVNKNGKLCYWNDKCLDITTCDQLPKDLITDKQCREYLSMCTANVDGGCIESGLNCSDQTSEISCITNKDRNQPCFWNEDKCLDRTCENAPLLLTDKDCRNYLTVCTTQEGGGCVVRQQCADAKIEEACVTDISGNKCFWDGENCNIRVCENAPQDLQTNRSCDDFLTNCITNGNGCVENTECEAAIVEQACDLSNGKCHWDGTYCLKKTCENAGPNFVGHEACNNFFPNCTAKVGAGSGCLSISCLSAPLINNTNQLCEQYLPDHNCVTKNGGGCRVNSSCEAIDIEIGCIKNINDEICFWYQGKCKTKTCLNAPSSYNSKQQCSEYLQDCTIGNNNKCADKLCENFTVEDECTFDIFKNPCAEHKSCQNKQCSYASKSITTHIDCQQYLSKCTVDNSGSGCMEIPQQCSMITNSNGCVINQNQNKCGWNGNTCIDYICSTAPNNLNNTQQCQQYKNGCVVNNNLNGCMDLPILCNDRKQQLNCEIETGSAVKCQWNTTDSNCINIDCTNAHKISLKGNVSQNGCWNYYSLNCVINSDGTQCIPRPSNCDGLAQNACQQQNVLVDNSNCFWDSGSSTCKIRACSSITLTNSYTHDNCQQQINSCTVNSTNNGCINLSSCDQYIFQPQCVIDQNYLTCQWNGNSCVDKNCADAADDLTNITDYACWLFSRKCTVTSKKCAIKYTSCSSNYNQYSCEQHTLDNKTQCAWINNQCQDSYFSCYNIKGIGMTPGYCSSISSNCSVNSLGTYCVQVQDRCSYYWEQECRWATSDGYCTWGGSSCQVDCSRAQGPFFDIDYCQTFNGQCTANRDASKCVLMQMNCSDTLPENCTRAFKGFCYLISGTSTCVDGMSTPTTDCGSITGTRLPILYCELVSSMYCTVNSYFNSCVKKEIFCGSYLEGYQCVNAWVGKCVFTGGCNQVGFSMNMCESIYIYGLTQYTDFHCKQYYKEICVANSSLTGCQMINSNQNTQIQCNSFTGSNLRYYDCVDKSNLCSVNAAKTNCVFAKTTCPEYTDLSECSYATQEGDCQVSDNLCIQKQCDNVPQAMIDNAQCQTYSSNCISHIGGCQIRASCSSYLFNIQCIQNSDGLYCFWNPSTRKCVTKECGNAESSTYFDNDEKCQVAGNCTVKANQDFTIGQGCIPRSSCSSYTIKEQCKLNDKGVACIWNTNNPQSPVCSDKSCSTALLTVNNHSDCQQYLSGCTVDIIDSVPQGCTSLKPCDQYIVYDQCQISSELDSNNNQIICDWNGTICGNKGCLTANNTYNTPTKCSQYYQGCTVNSSNDGCINIPKTCEGMTQQQCYSGSLDSNNRECYWINNQCITKTCSNSPKQQSESDCQSHLSTCTLRFSSCYSIFCSDFQLSTESDCLTAVPSGLCTSNGSSCIPKSDCSDTHIQQGCTKDNKGRKCEWVTNDDGSSQCFLQSCFTAPKTLKTEIECLSYYKPIDGSTCTTKYNGGCIVKGDCTTLTIQPICTIDNKGQKCVWDTDTSQCRYPNCKDISGTSHTQCNSIDSKCTVGLKGKCAALVRCEDTKIKEACISGTNGPCLWIAGYKNSDNSLGACFLYSSCQSLNWTTDTQCKLISPHCTTDGQRCVGTNKCSELSTQGGCLKGTDGLCVITPKGKDSKDLICKRFTICNDAYYLTHDECLKANSNCTSDYQNGCVPLTECSKYTVEGQCQIDNLGILKDEDEKLISTGKCTWDKANNKCRDQICTDIQLTTELDCQSQFYNCTSDGQNCLLKQYCVSYVTQNACELAGGLDGPCFWIEATESTEAFCRLKVCNDIKNGSSAIQCSEVADCIFDGSNCIDKAQCSSYITMVACQSTGKDGVCIWIDGTISRNGKCQRMTSCADSKDEFSCTQAKNRCNWLLSKNQCTNHTCDTFQSQEKNCTYFYSFDQKKYNICSLKDGKCVETDPSSLNQENCYNMSGRLYSWNPLFQKCAQCERVLQNEIFDEDGKDFLTVSQPILRILGCWIVIFLFQF